MNEKSGEGEATAAENGRQPRTEKVGGSEPVRDPKMADRGGITPADRLGDSRVGIKQTSARGGSDPVRDDKPGDRRPPEGRRALLIGIDEYPYFGDSANLGGCINDVELMARLLHGRFGFPLANIEKLCNEKATREGILEAMERLLTGTEPDDIVVIHYSGHGSRIPSLDPNEPSGMDETLVPHDGVASLGEGARDIRDDEIRDWLQRLSRRTPYITLVFDSCFSGSIARRPSSARVRSLPPEARGLEELPPKPAARERDRGPSGWLPVSSSYVLLAGCRDDECAFEVRSEEQSYGALTFYLNQEIEKGDSRDLSYLDLFERASAKVNARFGRQHPQLEGDIDRELFGSRELSPMRYFSVLRRDGDRVTLGGGAAHGMTTGSEWAIHPPATREITETTALLGLVRIESVGAVTSEARVVSESQAGSILEAARAVEHSHDYGEMRLRVRVGKGAGARDSLAELEARIDSSGLLRRVSADEERHVDIEWVAPRSPSDRPFWSIADEGGQLAAPPLPVDTPEGLTELVGHLERISRYRHALGIENSRSALEGKIDVALKRCRTASAGWQIAVPDAESKEIIFFEGDLLGIEVVNRSDVDIYVNVLDFGLTGNIYLLHPISHANVRLPAGRKLEVGIAEGEEIELFFPDEFPFDGGVSNEGTEHIKVFVTTQEANFSPLLRKGLASRAGRRHWFRGENSPLGQLLELACTGSGTRDPRPLRGSDEGEWLTLWRRFTLRRPG